MKILRWIAVAFSMFSRIPMPVFEWKEDDMSGGIMFLPLVGMVIGAFSVGIYCLARYMGLPDVATILLLGLIPVVITGGFHVDGYMDVTDALKSYQPKEKKLEIMKDPHIGAFAVIGLLGIILVYGAGLDLIVETGNLDYVVCYGCIFVIMRAVSGISSVTMKKAKKTGMLYDETRKHNTSALIVLAVQLLMGAGLILFINIWIGLLILGALAVVLIYYRHTAYSQFGGVTGDTSGYLVTLGETALVLVLGVSVWCGL